MPGQQKPIGYWNSTGTSLGFGERSDPLKGDVIHIPGAGTYEVGKNADENEAPKWK